MYIAIGDTEGMADPQDKQGRQNVNTRTTFRQVQSTGDGFCDAQWRPLQGCFRLRSNIPEHLLTISGGNIATGKAIR